MNRSFALSLLGVASLFVLCSFLNAAFAQSTDQVNLSGTYTGDLKYPAADLNGKATLNVEGNKFVLRGANGTKKTGRITASKTGGDFVSVAMMFDETPTETQPFSHSIISVRLRQNRGNLTFVNAPGETREFYFQTSATESNRNSINSKTANLQDAVTADCKNPSARCPINFGSVTAQELENARQLKPVSEPQPITKRSAKNAKSKSVVRNGFGETNLKSKNSSKVAHGLTALKAANSNFPPENAKQNPPLAVEAGRESDLIVFREATVELRRATTELRRANEQVKAATDELRLLRTEKSAAPASTKNTLAEGKPAASETTDKNAAKAKLSSAKKPATAGRKIKNFSGKNLISTKNSTSKTKTNTAKKLKRPVGAKQKKTSQSSAPEKPAAESTPPAIDKKASPNPTPSTTSSPSKNADVGKSPGQALI